MTGITKSDDEVRSEFDEAVNMTAKQLSEWRDTDESKSVGQDKDDGDGDGDGESKGHESGRRIVEILEQGEDDVTDDDLDQMRRGVSYVHRHAAQRPDRDVTRTAWRYSLMNWGHDPLG